MADKVNWKKVRKNVGRVTNKALEKTGEIADMASMHIKLKTLEAKRKEQFAILGKLTYRQIKTGESQAEKIAPVIEELDALREKILAAVTDIESAKKGKAEKAEKAETKEEAKAPIEVSDFSDVSDAVEETPEA